LPRPLGRGLKNKSICSPAWRPGQFKDQKCQEAGLK
jgi:hypothetical protein